MLDKELSVLKVVDSDVGHGLSPFDRPRRFQEENTPSRRRRSQSPRPGFYSGQQSRERGVAVRELSGRRSAKSSRPRWDCRPSVLRADPSLENGWRPVQAADQEHHVRIAGPANASARSKSRSRITTSISFASPWKAAQRRPKRFAAVLANYLMALRSAGRPSHNGVHPQHMRHGDVGLGSLACKTKSR